MSTITTKDERRFTIRTETRQSHIRDAQELWQKQLHLPLTIADRVTSGTLKLRECTKKRRVL